MNFSTRVCRRFGQSFLALCLIVISSMAAGAKIPDGERAALTGLYSSTNGDGWISNANWCDGPCPLAGAPVFAAAGTECTWYGVLCDASGSHVQAILLDSNHLAGSIPSLDGLAALQAFDVSNNQLTGQIPDLSALSALHGVNVGHNRLVGSLPQPAAALSTGFSSICPNPLDLSPGPFDSAWNAATGLSPWWGPAGSGCDLVFSNGFSNDVTHFAVSAVHGVNAGSPASFTVIAQDAQDNVVTSYSGSVHFTSTDPSAVLPADSLLIDGAGTFNFTLETAGAQTISATDGAILSLTGTSDTIVVYATAATSLFVGSPSTAGAGNPLSVTISALDAFGNLASSYRGSVHFSSTDGLASLPSDYTFVGDDVGVHTFTNAATLRIAGIQTITATDTLTAAVTGTSGAITVTPAATASFVVSAPSLSGAGVALSVSVTAKDAFGNSVPSYAGTVHFSSTDGLASLPSDYTFVGADAGVHTFNGGATLRIAGTQTITATDTLTAGVTGTSGAITVTPAATASFVVSAPSLSGAGIAFSFSVTARDAFSNTTPSYAGSVHFTSNDGLASLPADYTFLAADAGVHVFTSGATLRIAGAHTITATDTVSAILAGTSAAITVTPAATASFVASTILSSGAGIAFSLSVTAKDAFFNTTPSYAGTVHFSSTDGLASLPSNYTFLAGDAGVRIFNSGVTLRTAGTQTVTATDTATASVTGTSGAITVAPAATASFVVNAPSNATAGAAFSFAVTAKDAFNNTTPSYSGTAHFSSTDVLAILPSNYTFVGGDAGVHIFGNAATLNTAGAQTITATDTVNASVTGTSGVISVP